MFEPSLKGFATLFRLDDEGWERHANPWSVWTRVATWPVLMLVLWSFHWFAGLRSTRTRSRRPRRREAGRRGR